MKLSAPIHVLRAQAKRLKTEQNLSLTTAQNTIAKREGYASWSQLIARQTKLKPETISELKNYLNNGDLILLGARPRLGKVRLAARLIAEAA